MNQKNQIQKLINKYQNDIGYYRSAKYNETQLRTDFLDQLFSIFGWDITNAAGKPTNEREVLVEEGLKARAGENTKKPDYTFRLFSERKFFLEAKKPSVDISNAIVPALQAAFFKIVVAQSCFKQPLFAPARVSRAAPDLASRHR
ncbi:hypothetical protein [Aeromonas rivipollensis]|uniref:hypothetical protein n=1 Tax=Aeromonas rivipollensis TaxID=948519 RepID=UPI00399CC1BA